MRRTLPTRGRTIEEGLAARVRDPLWLLARQWQFGEFRHENTASPAWAEVGTEHHVIDQSRPQDGAMWQQYDVRTTPLETRVESHDIRATPRLRLEGGRRWRRHVGDADTAAFVARCPFPDTDLVDAADRRLRRALPDGAPLSDCLRRLVDAGAAETEFAALEIAGPLTTARGTITAAARSWLDWWEAELGLAFGDEGDCWDQHRMEHTVAMRSSTLPAVELRAVGYAGGRLDWSSFDAFTVGDAPATPITTTTRAVPAPARFGGMPAPRFWEMEDARFDPGSVSAGPIDLGRLMLVGFATVYGNDWFALPLPLPVASLSRISSFVVRDVFGRPHELPPLTVDVDGWNIFGLTLADVALAPDQERPTSPWFLLAPSLPASLEGPPNEIVLLVRDEMANMGWAVEAVVADDHGRPRDRFDDWSARVPRPPVMTEAPRYVVASEVPDHWFPLAPEQLADLESIRLRLVPLSRLVDGVPVHQTPLGTLLPAGDAWLFEEEVPRSGVQVTRAWQYARWHDGSRHVWQGRHKQTGRGEGSSGLRFDQVVEPEGGED